VSNILIRAVLILVGSILVWYGLTGLATGSVRAKGGLFINREESPASYWLGVVIYLITGIGGILYAIFCGLISSR